MYRPIQVEQEDLRQSAAEITNLLCLLENNELVVKQQLNDIADWRGNAADGLKTMYSQLQSDMVSWKQLLEQRRIDIDQYVQDMRRADGQY